MKTIVEALKQTEEPIVLQNLKRGLRMWWEDKSWKVREKMKSGSFIKNICCTKDQKIAVDFLLGKRT